MEKNPKEMPLIIYLWGFGLCFDRHIKPCSGESQVRSESICASLKGNSCWGETAGQKRQWDYETNKLIWLLNAISKDYSHKMVLSLLTHHRQTCTVDITQTKDHFPVALEKLFISAFTTQNKLDLPLLLK